MEKKFELGHILMTSTISKQTAIDAKLSGFIFACLQKHQSGDWGDLPEEDKAINNQALEIGSGTLFGAYRYVDNSEIWIMTDCNQKTTTILRPEDY